MCLGIPGKIVSIQDEDPLYRMGKVEFSGVQKDISLAYVPEAEAGDYVIVHAGFAINVIDEEEANQVFQYLNELGEIEAELEQNHEIPQ
ncbi:HypC/HybG/HupF family hydrogenase formation chaperone [bacterium]|nr:HypC/HybG/HupF family hydrogenase formation chaperone [bacterium]